MALHIELSQEAKDELSKQNKKSKLISILFTSLITFLIGSMLYLTICFISLEEDLSFISYVPPIEETITHNTPTVKQLSSKASSPSLNLSPSIIISNTSAPVSFPISDNMNLDDSIGLSTDIGIGLGSDIGSDIGNDGSGLGVTSSGSALEGIFFDLKQTKSCAPMNISNDDIIRIISEFINSSWNISNFKKYYQSDIKLYASNFCLPSCAASYAPKAYQCSDKVKPSGWVALYRGKVKAPKSGIYRFVGTGDDVLIVRFNNKIVLESGWCIPSLYGSKVNPGTIGSLNSAEGKEYHKNISEGKDNLHKGYEFILKPELSKWNKELGGLTGGTEFYVKEGETYPIEILISEIPGGAFGFVLLMQEKINNVFDNTKFDLFRTNFACPDKKEIYDLINKEGCGLGDFEFPVFNEDSPIWIAQ